MKIIVGVTGASGSIYAYRLLLHLRRLEQTCELIVTESGSQVVKYERMDDIYELAHKVHKIDNFFAGPASGSSDYEHMIILPSSMGTVAKIANGISDNLLTRAADVFIKEKKSLVICPRETPYSSIHLDNMKKLCDNGVRIVPTNPFFYYHPVTLDELVDTVVGKVLSQIGIKHDLYPEWGGESDSVFE